MFAECFDRQLSKAQIVQFLQVRDKPTSKNKSAWRVKFVKDSKQCNEAKCIHQYASIFFNVSAWDTVPKVLPTPRSKKQARNC